MKRMSFILVLMVVLAGVPLMAVGSQNTDPSPGSGSGAHLTINNISSSGTEVTIDYTFHSNDPTDEIYYGYVEFYSDHDPSNVDRHTFGRRLAARDSGSVSFHVQHSGTWWFKIGQVAGFAPESDVIESDWMSAEVVAFTPTSFDMDFSKDPTVMITVSFNEPLSGATLTSHPGSCSVDGHTMNCSALLSDFGDVTFLIDVETVHGFIDEVWVKGYYPGRLTLEVTEIPPGPAGLMLPPGVATPLGFASDNPDNDVRFTWSRNTVTVSVRLSDAVHDAFMDIPNAACNVASANRVVCHLDMAGLEPGGYGAELTMLDLAGNPTTASVTWDWKGNLDDYVALLSEIHFGNNSLDLSGPGARFCPGPDTAGWVKLTMAHEQDRLPIAELEARIHFFYDEANNQVSLGNIVTRGSALASGFRLVNEQVGGLQNVWVPEVNAWAKAQLEAWGKASIILDGTRVSTEERVFLSTMLIDVMLYPDGTCDVTGYPRPSNTRGLILVEDAQNPFPGTPWTFESFRNLGLELVESFPATLTLQQSGLCMIGMSDTALEAMGEVTSLPEWIDEHLVAIVISPEDESYEYGHVGTSNPRTGSLIDHHGKWKSLHDIWMETGFASVCG